MGQRPKLPLTRVNAHIRGNQWTRCFHVITPLSFFYWLSGNAATQLANRATERALIGYCHFFVQTEYRACYRNEIQSRYYQRDSFLPSTEIDRRMISLQQSALISVPMVHYLPTECPGKPLR